MPGYRINRELQKGCCSWIYAVIALSTCAKLGTFLKVARISSNFAMNCVKIITECNDYFRITDTTHVMQYATSYHILFKESMHQRVTQRCTKSTFQRFSIYKQCGITKCRAKLHYSTVQHDIGQFVVKCFRMLYNIGAVLCYSK